ncbi:MAG: His-Xaa-Ser system-associated MauG-like protein [Pseudomonadota bacterium]
MKSVTSFFVSFFLITAPAIADDLRSTVLRNAAIEAGFLPSSQTRPPIKRPLADLGKLAFESRLMSIGQDIACSTCHLDRFGSGDGLANAVGIGGAGAGKARAQSGGRVIPRNTLPFWGRGGIGFDTFFWDGKVSGRGKVLRSQFGPDAPSTDPLVISAMLPPVEIDEMVGDIGHLTTETFETAQTLYDEIIRNLASDKTISEAAETAFGVPAKDLEFVNFAEAIAEFLRFNFAVQDTRFHRFVFGDGELNDNEIAGGLIFYGKGRCSQCHNGPYFSDLDFHAIPSPNSMFGKNGFGVDLGRFNVTNNPDELAKFRTPPLYNVTKTAPYGHSGAFEHLSDVIIAHSDPLAVLDMREIGAVQRQGIYQQLRLWAGEPVAESILVDVEIAQLVSFLGTLEYQSRLDIVSPNLAD